jgi:hypothetical protein
MAVAAGETFDAGEPLKLFGQYRRFESALAGQGDVAEFCPAHGRVAVLPGTKGIGRAPEVLHAVRGCVQDLHNVGAPELG